MTVVHPLFGELLPQGWELTTVDGIKSPEPSSCVAGPFGSNISSKYFVDEGVPIIRGSNLRDDLTPFVPTGFAFVSPERARAYASQHVRAGDLVFTCWGTVGQVGLIPANGPFTEYIISNKQLKLRPNTSRADSRYLFYYFASPQMVQHVRSRAIGAAVPGINLGILKALPVVLPPLATQQRMVELLGAYDDLIDNCERRIRVLDEMARALYREWFVLFRYPGHTGTKKIESSLGWRPETWHEGTLEDVVSLQRGFDITKAEQKPGPYPVISSSGPNSTHSEYKATGPGIVLGRKGTLGTVFYSDGPYWPHDTTLWVTDFHGHGPWYAYFLLQGLGLQKYDCGASNPTLNRNHLHKLPIIVPGRELTIRYDQIVGEMMKHARMLREQCTNLRKTRDLLLPRLLSGQIPLDA